jgi:transforming growth factor-beta-induced protein
MRYIVILSAILLLLLPVYAQESTIAELVADNPELSQFASLLERAEPSILEKLNDPEAQYTLFAPTNTAFEALDAALAQEDSWQREAFAVDSLEALLENSDFLNELLLLHITDTAIAWEDLVESLRIRRGRHYLFALNDYPIAFSATFNIAGDLVDGEGIRLFSESTIDQTQRDIEAINGNIYVIDGVLIPEVLTIIEYLTLVASLEEYSEYNRLLDLINAADPAISELLSDPDANLTLFAPLDLALESLDDFEGILSDSTAATDLLSRHILAEAVYSFQIYPLQAELPLLEQETINGELLSFEPAEDAFSGQFYVNDVFVSYPNLPVRNGVIHEMESIVLPATD